MQKDNNKNQKCTATEQKPEKNKCKQHCTIGMKVEMQRNTQLKNRNRRRNTNKKYKCKTEIKIGREMPKI